jgi:hypothetical protein
VTKEGALRSDMPACLHVPEDGTLENLLWLQARVLSLVCRRSQQPGCVAWNGTGNGKDLEGSDYSPFVISFRRLSGGTAVFFAVRVVSKESSRLVFC